MAKKRVRLTRAVATLIDDEVAVTLPPDDVDEDGEEYRRGIARAAERRKRQAEIEEEEAEERRIDAERAAAKEAKRLAEEERDRIWDEEIRLRREARQANALVNYNTLVRSLLPDMMDTDFSELPTEQQHTIVALMKRTAAYLEAKIQGKPWKVRQQLHWSWPRDEDD